MEKYFYRSVKPWVLTQKFGEDKACYALDPKKVPQYLYKENDAVCPVGYRSTYSNMKGHNGLDLVAYRWQPVYAAREGIVVEVSTEVERGLGVVVEHDFGKRRFRTKYWHFIGSVVHRGDKVMTGQLLGYADSTGYSTGDHLHFEIKEIDKNGNIMNYDNGFFGAIDPEPLMYSDYAVEINNLRLLIEKLTLQVESLVDWLRARRV